MCTHCPFKITCSNRKSNLSKRLIVSVHPFHNHTVSAAHAKIAQKKSEIIARDSIAQLVVIFGPLILSNQKLRLGDVCKTLRSYLPQSYVLSSKAIQNILRAVIKEVKKGDYQSPAKLDPNFFVFDRELDETSNRDCAATLKKLLANQDSDTTWIVSRFMTETKDRDPFFDYRIHLDVSNEVDCVVWQTGRSRGAFEKYGRQIFLDTWKSKNMNSMDMRAVTLVVIDGNRSFIPALESFVFEESLERYRLVCQYILDITPGIKAEDVCHGDSIAVFQFLKFVKPPPGTVHYINNVLLNGSCGIITCDSFHT